MYYKVPSHTTAKEQENNMLGLTRGKTVLKITHSSVTLERPNHYEISCGTLWSYDTMLPISQSPVFFNQVFSNKTRTTSLYH